MMKKLGWKILNRLMNNIIEVKFDEIKHPLVINVITGEIQQ